jgi:peptide/nickel transport system substrate-binding protein
MRRHLSILSAFVVSLAALSAPAHAATLRIGLGEDTDTLDPAQGRTFGGRQIFAALCDKLFDLDQNANVVGQLVTDWTVSEDGLTITLNLRNGVVFHDGTPFNAEAVKFNIERSLTLEESARKGDIRAIRKVEVVDDDTVNLILNEPFAPLLAQLADRAGMMVSPTAVKAVDTATFASAPVCSGPFKFKERVVQDRVVVERFADYWNEDAIRFDEIVYRPMPDSTVRLNNLLSGELDMMERIATSDLPRLEGNPAVKVVSVTGLGHVHIQFNVASSDPLASNAKLRQAMDAAIDRNVLNKVVFNDLYVAGNQPVSPQSPFYAKNHPVTGADLEKAKALVAESGLGSPKLTMILNNEPQHLRAGQVVQSMLREAGIEVELQPVAGGVGNGLMAEGNFQAFLGFWSGRADPDANAYTYLGCKGAQNFGKYCSEPVEKLLASAAQNSDPAKRTEFYSQAADLWMTDLPVIYLYHEKRFFGLASGIEGFQTVPDGIIRIQGVSKAE